MKTIIKATVLTAHQLGSLTAFGMGFHKHTDGSFSTEREFASKEDAIEFLKSIAHQYWERTDADDHDLEEMYEEIDKTSSLRLDAAVASIEEIEEIEGVINWSSLSRLITEGGDRTSIRSNNIPKKHLPRLDEFFHHTLPQWWDERKENI